jgi:hypothetical protein
MGELVIAAYRPKPGREDDLVKLVRLHVPFLRDRGLATNRPVAVMQAADGTVVEVFEWRDGGIAAAHEDPEVGQLWGKFAEVCDFVPLRGLAETERPFAEFRPLEV